jgi:hypothetical protein
MFVAGLHDDAPERVAALFVAFVSTGVDQN